MQLDPVIEALKVYGEIIFRLLLAAILGGSIGYEREHMRRPAGFRTHILVCVGAALVMVTSEFIFRQYSEVSNLDPARLGAQVISGIGFLGAGTIIRDGFNVRGLTTAASLWAVSCVGIAVGTGFYEGAIAATILIFVTLISLRKLEKYFTGKRFYKVIYVQTENIPGQVASISNILEKYQTKVKTIEFTTIDNETDLVVRLLIKLPGALLRGKLVGDLQSLQGVSKVYEE